MIRLIGGREGSDRSSVLGCIPRSMIVAVAVGQRMTKIILAIIIVVIVYIRICIIINWAISY